MNGIFGIADSRARPTVDSTVQAMVRAMSHSSADGSAWAGRAGSVAIGRVSRGSGAPTPPTSSDDGRIDVCFHGTLWNLTSLRPQADQDSPATRGATIEELLLRLYQTDGPAFVERLNGEFVVAVVDRTVGDVLLATDPLGMFPMYWAARDGRLVFAPAVRGVLAALPRPQLDRTALAQYMRFQTVLGERTFFEEVQLVPRGSLLRFRLSDGVATLRPYTDVTQTPSARTTSFAEVVDVVGPLLDAAVRRRSAAGRVALFLTGGLDSRLLLAALVRNGVSARAFTYGCGDSRDVVYARRVARLARIPHEWCPITDGRWVEAYATAHLDSTEGFHPWLHGHGINTLDAVRAHADVVVTGWGGGTIVGGWLNFFRMPGATADDTDLLTAELFRWFNVHLTWPGLSEAEEHILYTSTLAAELRGRAFTSMRDEVARYMSCRADLRAEMFFLFNHDFRFLQPWTSMLREQIETASPYFDLDLFRGVYAFPARARGYRALMRALLQRWSPRLSLVPYDRDDLLPTTVAAVRRVHDWASRITRKINAHVAHVFPEYRPLALDYEHWTRTDLREWSRDLVVGERTLARGLFNPHVLRALWDRMQSGREPNFIGKIAPIMTYELMLRRFYDDAP